MARRQNTLLVLLLVGLSVSRASAQTQTVGAVRQAVARTGGRAIIVLKSGTGGAAMRVAGSNPLSDLELETVETRLETQYPIQITGHAPIVGAVFTTVRDADIARLLADKNVDYIEPDVLVPLAETISLPGAPGTKTIPGSVPWGVSNVNAPAAWAAGLTGAGVKVGMMDTGIDVNHPDLVVSGGYNFDNSSTDYNDNVSSCGGHGTHTAGTVAARGTGGQITGVAPNVTLYALKVFGDYGGCLAYLSSQILAMQWAVTNHLDVISISIANSPSFAYDLAVTTALGAGISIVAAAGNDGGGPIVYPGAATGAIAVGALNSDNSVAGYSNAGAQMWVAAPGTSIESTMPGGGTGYKSGTSMATPHVAGLVALVRQAHPGWTPDQVRNEIKNLASDINIPGWDPQTGWGIAQAPTSNGAPIPLSMSVSPVARSVSVQQGNAAPSDNASITISGTGASSTAWSASKRQAWTTLTTASGTGSGTVAWSRNASGLAVGTYVDTITVTSGVSSGSPSVIYDTLRITAAPPPPPLAIAVSPLGRKATVQVGNAAPSDVATVTLSGTGASSATWSASKRKSWTTLTTAAGTGTGTVAWSRNSAGLGAGTYVDTITVTASGATGSPTMIMDTLVVTAAPVGVTLAVSPTSRSANGVANGASIPDAASVIMTGDNAWAVAWTATKRRTYTTLTTASGSGNGVVAWSRSPAGLTAGTYVDTITVGASATGSPATIIDTFIVAPGSGGGGGGGTPIPLTVAVSPASRSVSVSQSNAAPADNASVTIAGTNAASTNWTASSHHSWIALTRASGTGDGMVMWSRYAVGLAPGIYVDTITVTVVGATNSPARVIDTLRVVAGSAPTTISISPLSRHADVVANTTAPSDDAVVYIGGDNASSVAWTATARKSWTSVVTASGTGSATVSWNRNAAGLAAGTYVDTITVTVNGSPTLAARVIDTLRVTATVVPLTIAVNPASRRATVQVGSAAPSDNGLVTIAGDNASSTSWTATARKSWTTLVTASGTGSGPLVWNRNASGLGVGTYVDTITVSASGATGSPATIIDTLRIVSVPVPLVLTVSPHSRSASVQQGSIAPDDNAVVTLEGDNAGSTIWVASARKIWTSFTNSNGTGSGVLQWRRNAAGLVPGIYVDTISVVATGAEGSPVRVIDTLRVTAAPVPLTIAVTPSSRRISIEQNHSANGDVATVTLSGDNAAASSWTASARKSWTTLSSANGVGNGVFSWSRNTALLAPGTYVDTISVSAGTSASTAFVFDTIEVIATPVGIAVQPQGRRARMLRTIGHATIVLPAIDSILVTGNAGTLGDSWVAQTDTTYLRLTRASGHIGNYAVWERKPVDLPLGLHIDTVRVHLAADPSVVTAFVDSVDVVDVTLPAPDAAVKDLILHGNISSDQRLLLDRDGNKNGTYDLGDFLAWVQRAGIRLSPSTESTLRGLLVGRR